MQQHNRHGLEQNMLPELETLVGYNLKRAYMIMQADFRAVMADRNMSPRVFSALTLVVNIPDITQSEVSRRLGIERSGLVAIVDALEGDGYLRRVPVPTDRRVQALRPTSKGVAVYEDAAALVRAHEDRMLSGLTAAERDQLITFLHKIRETEEEGSD